MMSEDIVLLCAQLPGREPVVYDLVLKKYVVGRDPACDIVVDTSPEISRRHLELTYHDGAYWVEPKGLYGTWHKDKKIEAPVQLASGDVLKLPGDVLLKHVVCTPDKRAPTLKKLQEGIKVKKGRKIPVWVWAYLGVLLVLALVLLAGKKEDTAGGPVYKVTQREGNALIRPERDANGDLKNADKVGDPVVRASLIQPKGGKTLRDALGVTDEGKIDWAGAITDENLRHLQQKAQAVFKRERADPASWWRYLVDLVDIYALACAEQLDPERTTLKELLDKRFSAAARKELRTVLLAHLDAMKMEVDERLLDGYEEAEKGFPGRARRNYAFVLRMVPDPNQPVHVFASQLMARLKR